MPGQELATTTSSALAIRPDQTQWTDEQLVVLRHMSTDKASPADLQVFLHRCQTLGLDPFAGQVHLVEYGGKPTIQVGVHGLETLSQDIADRRGVTIEWEEVLWCGPDGQWTDVWLSDAPPAAAKAVVLRDGKRFPATVLYREFVGTKKVYRNNKWTGEFEVNAMWSAKPAYMLGKCARAAALRSAFPHQLADVRIPEELGERPDIVRGELARDDDQAAAAPALSDALELVAAATTRDELMALWEQYAPLLGVTDRAHLRRACQEAPAANQAPPQPGPEDAELVDDDPQ